MSGKIEKLRRDLIIAQTTRDDLQAKNVDLVKDLTRTAEKVRIKQLFIDDAKAKIRSINMEYFGVSSEKLSDLEDEVRKTIDVVEKVADIVTLFVNDEITKEEARNRVNKALNKC